MHPGQINNRIYRPRFTCGCAVTGRGRKILPVSHYGLSHTAATDEPAMRTVVGTCVKFLFSSPSPQPLASHPLLPRKNPRHRYVTGATEGIRDDLCSIMLCEIDNYEVGGR